MRVATLLFGLVLILAGLRTVGVETLSGASVRLAGDISQGAALPAAAERADAASLRLAAKLDPWRRDLAGAEATLALAGHDARPETADGTGAESLQNSLRLIDRALSLAPMDANLWFVRAAVLARSQRDVAEWEASLRASYELGPREGWVVWRRLAFALPHFGRFSPDTQALADGELDRMVGRKSSFLSEFANAYARLPLETRFTVDMALERQPAEIADWAREHLHRALTRVTPR